MHGSNENVETKPQTESEPVVDLAALSSMVGRAGDGTVTIRLSTLLRLMGAAVPEYGQEEVAPYKQAEKLKRAAEEEPTVGRATSVVPMGRNAGKE